MQMWPLPKPMIWRPPRWLLSHNRTASSFSQCLLVPSSVPCRLQELLMMRLCPTDAFRVIAPLWMWDESYGNGRNGIDFRTGAGAESTAVMQSMLHMSHRFRPNCQATDESGVATENVIAVLLAGYCHPCSLYIRS